MRSYLLLSLCLFSLTACLGGAGDESTPALLPIISFSCANVLPECVAATGKPVYLGLVSGSVDCMDYLNDQNSGTFHYGFDASGSTTGTFANGFLEGSVSSWVANNGAGITTLPDVSYTACAYVDSNNDGYVGINEVIGQLENLRLTDIANNLIVEIWNINQ